MYTEPKFLAMKETSKAKRMAELLRVIILQLGDDVPRARREFETYAEWMKLPETERLVGKNQAQMIDLYKTFGGPRNPERKVPPLRCARPQLAQRL